MTEVQFAGYFERNRDFMTPWRIQYWERILSGENPGAINAHAHLDRSMTLGAEYFNHVGIDPSKASSISLEAKQNLTGDLHRGEAYKPENLRRRMKIALDQSIHYGVREVHSLIDTTADEARGAIDVAIQVKEEYSEKISLKVGVYGIFGFRDSEPERWKVFEERARRQDVDFLAGLPERDVLKGHDGYKRHIRRILSLGKELGKPVQMHVDQKNHPTENGTEVLVEGVDWGWPENYQKNEEPMVWAVHAISPSCYDEDRFQRLVSGLKQYNVGVICCPTAALGMRQYRGAQAPIHNSVARALEMIVAGVPVRFGTDNISDIFMPVGEADMEFQMKVFAEAVRFYDAPILAKMAKGITRFNETELDTMRTVLAQNKEENAKNAGKDYSVH